MTSTEPSSPCSSVKPAGSRKMPRLYAALRMVPKGLSVLDRLRAIIRMMPILINSAG